MATDTKPKPKKKKGKGKDARQQDPNALAHIPNLNRYYRYELPPITPGDYTFHVDLLRTGLQAFSLDRLTESLSWSDDAAALTGSVTCYRPDPLDPSGVPVMRGDMIRCRITWGEHGKFNLWTMRAAAPQVQRDAGTVTIPLADDLILLEGSDQDWIFRKTKHRPQGYTATEITRLVAKQLGLECGTIEPSTVKQSLIKRNATGKAAISAAWRRETEKTGRYYILRLYNGKLEVVTIQRNPHIYVLRKQIQTAAIAQRGGKGQPTTVLTGRAHIGKGKHAKKISFTAFDRKVVDTLGHVPATKNYGQVDSHKELKARVQRDLAKELRLADTITLDHPGIPFILRGDGAQIPMPLEGYKGDNSFVFCVQADHTVSDGQYTTEFEFGFTDPVLADLRAAAKAAKQLANKSVGRRLNTGGSGGRWEVTASAEDDPPGAQGACRVIQSDGYSELSTNPSLPVSQLDFAALGGIPCLTPMKITNPANGKTVTAVKQDKGAGSSFLPVMGIYPGTRSALGLGDAGQYRVVIERADGKPLNPVRGNKK